MEAFLLGCLCSSLLKMNTRGERYMQKQLYTAWFCYVTKVVRNIECLLYNISQPSRCP